MNSQPKQLNLLLLGGAKRVSVARMLQAAGESRGYATSIYSYELSPHVPIAAAGSVVIGRRWGDADILEHLHATVEQYHIDVMIPFVDMAVGVAARYRRRYDDVFVPASEPALCDAMFDKILAADLFERASIPAPASYHKGKPEFPLIAKPRHGSASKGIKVIRNAGDFRAVIAPAESYLIQEYIEHREEITVDCYVTRQGRICCISPRRRIEVVGGEVSHSATIDAPDVVDAARKAIESTGLRGAVTVQFMRDLDTGRLLIMEINPRLGGGVVCSVHAGADIPGMIIDEATGIEPAEATAIRPGTEIVRYFEEVVFHNDTAL